MATSLPPDNDHASYLDALPAETSLSDELAQLAEDSEVRPLLKHEQQRLDEAIYTCAVAVRRARPAAVRAQLEGRMDGQ